MTTDKSQPTGWVVVDFEVLPGVFLDGSLLWRLTHEVDGITPFASKELASDYRFLDWEVHPWPLPASVLARLKERHPTVDWSEVPVAKPTHAIGCHDGPTLSQYMADRLSVEDSLRAEVERLTRERDELREELADVQQRLQEHLASTTIDPRAFIKPEWLSRRDEFAKAALCGLLANSERLVDAQYRMDAKDTAVDAVAYADATIRALDGAGGA